MRLVIARLLNLPRRLEGMAIVTMVVATGFALLVSWDGVPSLRHDWFIVQGRADVAHLAWASLGGWSGGGIGAPQRFANDYLVVIASSMLSLVLGSHAGLFVESWLIAYLVASAAVRAVRRICLEPAGAAGVAIFSVVNPWVYNEAVAGHLFMILAYGAALLLVSEAISTAPSAPIIAVALLGTIQQIQFFIPALAIGTVLLLRSRQGALLLIAVVLCFAPEVLALVSERDTLARIPYNVTWQFSQSIGPAQAAILDGYFALYTAAFPPFVQLSLWGMALIAGFGALLAFARRQTAVPVGIGLTLFLFATGLKGPMAGAYQWLVAHVPASGVYRELYDVIGLATPSYLIAVAIAVRCARALGRVVALLACAVALAWFVVPPSRLWVPRSALPIVDVRAAPHSRFALLPPYQPLSFGSRGSGLDPDAYPRDHDVLPLNDAAPRFPEAVALSEYMRDGETGGLAALSVSRVIARPWLRSDDVSLAQELSLALPRSQANRNGGLIDDFTPELSMSDVPPISSRPLSLGGSWIFFSDAAETSPNAPRNWSNMPKLNPITPAISALDARSGWVDVTTAFAAFPKLGQGLGGVLTTSHTAVLAVVPGLPVLALIRGKLLNDRGAQLARTTDGYRWIALPNGVSRLRCDGLCAVVGQANPPSSIQDLVLSQKQAAIDFRVVAPWLIVATVPSHARSMLRYNTRYDPHWSAYVAGSKLPHVRMNLYANGWILQPDALSHRILIINQMAGVQFLLQILGLLLAMAIIAYSLAVVRQQQREACEKLT